MTSPSPPRADRGTSPDGFTLRGSSRATPWHGPSTEHHGNVTERKETETMAEFTHKVDFSTLDPAQKLHILKEMGFREDGPLEHTINCTSRQGSGLRCTCLPGTTSFK